MNLPLVIQMSRQKKILVYQVMTPAYKLPPFLNPCVRSVEQYAKAHNYTYKLGVVDIDSRIRNKCWCKIAGLIDELQSEEKWDYILFLDMDIFINNPEILLEQVIAENLSASVYGAKEHLGDGKDFGDYWLSGSTFMLKNTPRVLQMLKGCWELRFKFVDFCAPWESKLISSSYEGFLRMFGSGMSEEQALSIMLGRTYGYGNTEAFHRTLAFWGVGFLRCDGYDKKFYSTDLYRGECFLKHIWSHERDRGKIAKEVYSHYEHSTFSKRFPVDFSYVSSYSVEIKKRYIHHCDFVINDNCTMACKECNAGCPNIKETTMYSLERVQESLKNFDKHISVDDMYVLGGEPFLHPDLVKIMGMVLECPAVKKMASIVTNGTIFNKHIIDELAKLNKHGKSFLISISTYRNVSDQRRKEIKEYCISKGITCEILNHRSRDLWANVSGLKKLHTIQQAWALRKTCNWKCWRYEDGKFFSCMRMHNAYKIGLTSLIKPAHTPYLDLAEHVTDSALEEYSLPVIESKHGMEFCQWCNPHELMDVKGVQITEDERRENRRILDGLPVEIGNAKSLTDEERFESLRWGDVLKFPEQKECALKYKHSLPLIGFQKTPPDSFEVPIYVISPSGERLAHRRKQISKLLNGVGVGEITKYSNHDDGALWYSNRTLPEEAQAVIKDWEAALRPNNTHSTHNLSGEKGRYSFLSYVYGIRKIYEMYEADCEKNPQLAEYGLVVLEDDAIPLFDTLTFYKESIFGILSQEKLYAGKYGITSLFHSIPRFGGVPSYSRDGRMYLGSRLYLCGSRVCGAHATFVPANMMKSVSDFVCNTTNRYGALEAAYDTISKQKVGNLFSAHCFLPLFSSLEKDTSLLWRGEEEDKIPI